MINKLFAKRSASISRGKTVFACVVLLLCFQSILAKDTVISDDSLDVLESQVDAAAGQYKELTLRYLLPLEAVDAKNVSVVNVKINTGDFYFKKGDYISASSIYYSIFASSVSHDALWEESLFKLGDSLFHGGNYVSAIRYFAILLSAKPNSSYKIDALKRLVEASYRLGDYKSALRYYTAFVETGVNLKDYPDLLYFLAKSLYFSGSFDDALDTFLMLNPSDTYYPQARYFAGIIAMTKGDDARALSYFLQVAKLSPKDVYWKFDIVKTTAILAVARMYYQEDKLPEATEYYLMVNHTSPLFPDAYYELCWTYIRREMYTKAIAALDLIHYISPNSIVVPEAEVLEGTLMIKTRRFGEAMVQFNNIVRKYGNSLQQLTKARQDDVVDTTGFSVFSPLVRTLLNDSVKYKKALALKNQLSDIDGELKRVASLSDKLASALSNDNIASLYPPLKKGSEFSFVLYNRLVRYLDALFDIVVKRVDASLSMRDRKLLQQVIEKKAALKLKIQALPIDANGFEHQTSVYTGMFISLDEELHRTELQSKMLLEQLQVLRSVVERKNGESRASRSIRREEEFITSYIKQLEQQRNDVEQEKNRLLVKGDLLSRNIVLRSKYVALLQSEGDIVKQYLFALGSDAPHVVRLSSELLGLMKKTEMFDRRLNTKVHRMLRHVQRMYEEERQKLEAYKSELKELEKNVDDIARLALFSNVNKVREEFADIILRADQGVIDVAWEKKDTITKKLLRYRKRKARELQRLNLTLKGLE